MYTMTEDSYIFQVYSPQSNIVNPNAEAMNLSTAMEVNKNALKDFKNPDVTINPPKGPVRCPVRIQKKDKAIK